MTIDLLEYTMTTGAVAKVLDISPSHVVNLDEVLAPMRTSNGRRLYSPARVRAVAKARAMRKAG